MADLTAEHKPTTTPDFSGHRLIYLAPRAGISGVADYADDFIAAVGHHFGEVHEYRHGGPGEDGVLDILRHRRALRGLIAASPGVPTIVHSEQSGGAVVPFWATLGLRNVTVTATVHDPPYLVWWPFRTRVVAASRVLNHVIHLPLSRITPWLEAGANKSRTLFTLSALGARKLQAVAKGSTVIPAALFVPERPEVDPVVERPLAIGLFGYVYRGKGFDGLAALREALDDDIAIRVAGRGTEVLEPMPGVEVLGEVNGHEEDAFFNSIRMLLVPYGGRRIYGREAFPAASTVTRSIAYGTPVLARAYGSLRELESEGGSVVVDGGAEEICAAANALLRDDAKLTALQEGARQLKAKWSVAKVKSTFLAGWAVAAGLGVAPAHVLQAPNAGSLPDSWAGTAGSNGPAPCSAA